MVAVLLTVDGLQLPVIGGLSFELVGKVGAVPPSQIAAGVVNVGVFFGVTVIGIGNVV